MEKQCQCVDADCPVAHGPWITRDSHGYPCLGPATVLLFRIDMDDEAGTRFCDPCGDDAMDSGLYSVDRFDARDDAFGERR